MPDEPSFLTPSSSEQVAREAEIMLLSTMSRTLDTMTSELIGHRKDLTDIKVDIAAIKVRQEAAERMEEICSGLRRDIDDLKTRASQQDGAVTLATMMKDFGPWVISLGVLFWGLFGSPHK
jgi:hypothetical protein